MLEFLPGPEEVRVWLLLPHFHPVAVTVKILVPGEEEGISLILLYLYSFCFIIEPHLACSGLTTGSGITPSSVLGVWGIIWSTRIDQSNLGRQHQT